MTLYLQVEKRDFMVATCRERRGRVRFLLWNIPSSFNNRLKTRRTRGDQRSEVLEEKVV